MEQADPLWGNLADEKDELGWIRRDFGSMADHAALDDDVPTVPADEYLTAPKVD